MYEYVYASSQAPQTIGGDCITLALAAGMSQPHLDEDGPQQVQVPPGVVVHGDAEMRF